MSRPGGTGSAKRPLASLVPVTIGSCSRQLPPSFGKMRSLAPSIGTPARSVTVPEYAASAGAGGSTAATASRPLGACSASAVGGDASSSRSSGAERAPRPAALRRRARAASARVARRQQLPPDRRENGRGGDRHGDLGRDAEATPTATGLDSRTSGRSAALHARRSPSKRRSSFRAQLLERAHQPGCAPSPPAPPAWPRSPGACGRGRSAGARSRGRARASPSTAETTSRWASACSTRASVDGSASDREPSSSRRRRRDSLRPICRALFVTTRRSHATGFAAWRGGLSRAATRLCWTTSSARSGSATRLPARRRIQPAWARRASAVDPRSVPCPPSRVAVPPDPVALHRTGERGWLPVQAQRHEPVHAQLLVARLAPDGQRTTTSSIDSTSPRPKCSSGALPPR